MVEAKAIDRARCRHGPVDSGYDDGRIRLLDHMTRIRDAAHLAVLDLAASAPVL
jgi:hypothetical protein